ncbi:MAG: DegQ family serine endoprotease [Nitrospirota bacterium]
MPKRITVFIVLFSILLGVLIGSKLDIFSPKSPLYTQIAPRVPGGLAGESMAFSEIVKTVSPSVVYISTTKTIKDPPLSPRFFENPFENLLEPFHIPKKWKEQILGSGVIVSSDGYIITNYHVVEKADEIKVTLYDKENYKGEIIGSDPKTDIAIIKISAKDLPAVKWGDSDNLQVGEFVLAFGNPYGFSHTVTMGIVSAVGRANVGIADFENYIQTDAAINPGNSGGPLVNIKGDLVGINTAIFSRTGGYQGIGFAIPSNMAKLVMKQIEKGGKVTRGWLGVNIQNITPELAREFGLSKSRGALVNGIIEKSPAEKAGLKRGDIILEVNGKTVNDVKSLSNIVAQSEVGSAVKLKITREGKEITVKANVGELPKEKAEAVPGEPDELIEEKNELRGFSVIELTAGIAKQLGLSRDEKGVVVISVEPESAADEADLRKGDVIQEMKKSKVDNLRDFNNIVSHIKKGDTVLLFVNRAGKKFYITLNVPS